MTQKNELIFSIRHKILGSFVFVLLLSFAITGINIVGLQEFYQHFRQFNQESSDTNLMLKVDKNVSDLQRSILAFSTAEKGVSSAQLHRLRSQLSQDIAQLLANEVKNKRPANPQLKQMKQAADSFVEKIESLEKERTYRENLVSQSLGAIFDELDSKLDRTFHFVKHQTKLVRLRLFSNNVILLFCS